MLRQIFRPFLKPDFNFQQFKQSIPKFKTVLKVTAFTAGVQELATYSFAKSLTVDIKKEGDKPGEAYVFIPAKEELANSTIPEEKFALYGQISVQAARNLGCTRPIKVCFEEEEEKNSAFPELNLPQEMNAGCVGFFSNWKTRGAVFVINHRMVEKVTPEEMYAVAGHEAVHAHEDHTLLLGVLRYPSYALSKLILKTVLHPSIFFRVPVLSSLLLAINIQRGISVVLEERADLISAKRLGTAEQMSSFLQKADKDDEELINEYFKKLNLENYKFLIPPLLLALAAISIVPSDHPDNATRIHDLKKLTEQKDYPGHLHLFKSLPEVKISEAIAQDDVSHKNRKQG